jgi:hypothetical protein
MNLSARWSIGILAVAMLWPVQTLRLLRIIGWANSGPAYTFAAVGDIAALPAGGVAVLERSTAEVRIFDEQGRFVRALGGRGAAPGSLADPASIVVHDTLITVMDSARASATVFGIGGTFLGTTDLPSSVRGTPAAAGNARALRHGWVLAATAPHIADDGSAETHVRVLLAHASSPVDTLRTYASGMVLQRLPSALPTASALHAGDAGAWGAGGDSLIVLVDGQAGVVEWLRVESNGAVPWRRVELGWEQREITTADRADALRRLSGRGRRGGRGGRGTRGTPFAGTLITPSFFGAVDDVVVADDGTAWLRLREGFDATAFWLVVPPDGTSTRQLLMPDGFTPTSVSGRRILGLLRERGDALFVAIYWLG